MVPKRLKGYRKALSRLPERDRKLLDLLLFLLRLLALSVPLYLLMGAGAALYPLQRAVTAQSDALINALGIETQAGELVIFVGSCAPFALYIGPDCTGWKSMMLLSALMLATLRVGMRKRLLGIAVGVPLVYAGNIGRIALTVVIENAYGEEAALFLHDVLWQAGLTALVLCLWLVWLRWDSIRGSMPRLKHIIMRRGER